MQTPSERCPAAVRALILLCCCATALFTGIAAAARPDDNFRCSFVDPIYDIPKLWGFMAAFDFDETVVNPAIIDIGILNDGSARSGGERCNVFFQLSQLLPASFTCDASFGGAYTGVLPNRTTHGNNMKNILAATLNDGGWAGIAGQVATPNLYRFDEVHNYVFEMDATIDRAVSAGATSINISGGFPCAWKPSFSPLSTFDICTVEGRTAALLPFCIAPLVEPTAALIAAQSAFCTVGVGSIPAEGDIRDRINGAAARALVAGVPIVASAGNIENGLTGLLSGAVSGNADTLDWGILPATSSSVISVGAVDPDPPYGNFDFHGPDVDIWAPQNDTSPAAAFVSGLIALAQAINPQFHPSTADLTAGITGTLRNMLIDTARTNAVLDAAGHVDPSGLRGNLVDPYEFIRVVSEGIVPDYRALGYPEHFDSWVEVPLSGSDGRPGDCDVEQVQNDASDDAANPVIIPVVTDSSSAHGGAILFFDGAVQVIDEDWYSLSYAGLSISALHQSDVELRYPSGYGELELISPDNLLRLEATATMGAETVKTYRSEPMQGGAQVPFRVVGTAPSEDNIYRLIVSQERPTYARPDNFDVPTPNDSPTAATVVSPGTVPDGVTVETASGIHIRFGHATIHSFDDVDHFRVEGFDFPEEVQIPGIEFSVDAHSPDAFVTLRTLSGIEIASGHGSVEVQRSEGEPFLVEVSSRYPGLFAAYELTASVQRAAIDPAGSATQLAIDLAEFIERMDHRLAGRFPERGCVACNTLHERGVFDADRSLSGELIKGDLLTRLMQVERGGQLVLEGVTRQEAERFTVLNSELRAVRGGLTRSGDLVFKLSPGTYAVQWRPGPRGRRVGYAVKAAR